MDSDNPSESLESILEKITHNFHKKDRILTISKYSKSNSSKNPSESLNHILAYIKKGEYSIKDSKYILSLLIEILAHLKPPNFKPESIIDALQSIICKQDFINTLYNSETTDLEKKLFAVLDLLQMDFVKSALENSKSPSLFHLIAKYIALKSPQNLENVKNEIISRLRDEFLVEKSKMHVRPTMYLSPIFDEAVIEEFLNTVVKLVKRSETHLEIFITLLDNIEFDISRFSPTLLFDSLKDLLSVKEEEKVIKAKKAIRSIIIKTKDTLILYQILDHLMKLLHTNNHEVIKTTLLSHMFNYFELPYPDSKKSWIQKILGAVISSLPILSSEECHTIILNGLSTLLTFKDNPSFLLDDKDFLNLKKTLSNSTNRNVITCLITILNLIMSMNKELPSDYPALIDQIYKSHIKSNLETIGKLASNYGPFIHALYSKLLLRFHIEKEQEPDKVLKSDFFILLDYDAYIHHAKFYGKVTSLELNTWFDCLELTVPWLDINEGSQKNHIFAITLAQVLIHPKLKDHKLIEFFSKKQGDLKFIFWNILNFFTMMLCICEDKEIACINFDRVRSVIANIIRNLDCLSKLESDLLIRLLFLINCPRISPKLTLCAQLRTQFQHSANFKTLVLKSIQKNIEAINSFIYSPQGIMSQKDLFSKTAINMAAFLISLGFTETLKQSLPFITLNNFHELSEMEEIDARRSPIEEEIREYSKYLNKLGYTEVKLYQQEETKIDSKSNKQGKSGPAQNKQKVNQHQQQLQALPLKQVPTTSKDRQISVGELHKMKVEAYRIKMLQYLTRVVEIYKTFFKNKDIVLFDEYFKICHQNVIDVLIADEYMRGPLEGLIFDLFLNAPDEAIRKASHTLIKVYFAKICELDFDDADDKYLADKINLNLQKLNKVNFGIVNKEYLNIIYDVCQYILVNEKFKEKESSQALTLIIKIGKIGGHLGEEILKMMIENLDVIAKLKETQYLFVYLLNKSGHQIFDSLFGYILNYTDEAKFICLNGLFELSRVPDVINTFERYAKLLILLSDENENIGEIAKRVIAKAKFVPKRNMLENFDLHEFISAESSDSITKFCQATKNFIDDNDGLKTLASLYSRTVAELLKILENPNLPFGGLKNRVDLVEKLSAIQKDMKTIVQKDDFTRKRERSIKKEDLQYIERQQSKRDIEENLKKIKIFVDIIKELIEELKELIRREDEIIAMKVANKEDISEKEKEIISERSNLAKKLEASAKKEEKHAKELRELNSMLIDKCIEASEILEKSKDIDNREEALMFLPNLVKSNILHIKSSLPKIFQKFIEVYCVEKYPKLMSKTVEIAIEIIKTYGEENSTSILNLLETYLDKKYTPENQFNAIVLMGSCVPYIKDTSKVRTICDKILTISDTPSENLQKSLAKCLPGLIIFFNEPIKIAERLLDDLRTSDKIDKVRGSAYLLAGFVKGFGIKYIEKMKIIDFIEQSIESDNKKDLIRKQAIIALIQALIENLGQMFEPYFIKTLRVLMNFFGDLVEEIRVSSLKCTKAMMPSLSLYAIKQILPILLKGLEEKFWKSKVASIQVLGNMALCAAKQVSACLPQIVPKLAQAIIDPNQTVQEAVIDALKEIAKTIKNPEIFKISDTLIKSITNPYQENKKSLDALLHTEFVHYIESPALSLIIPVIDYGLASRDSSIRRSALEVVGSISSLIKSPLDLHPYLDMLITGFKFALSDQNNDVRSVASKSFATLSQNLDDQSREMIMSLVLDILESKESPHVAQLGAAQAYSEILISRGSDYLQEKIPSLLEKTQLKESHLREAYTGIFLHLPLLMGDELSDYIEDILRSIIRLFTSEHEESTVNLAMKVYKLLIQSYWMKGINVLIKPIEYAMIHEDHKMRKIALLLINDIILLIEKRNKNKAIIKTEEDFNKIFQTILVNIFILCSDTSEPVRNLANQIWRSHVENTENTLSSILELLLEKLMSIIFTVKPGIELRNKKDDSEKFLFEADLKCLRDLAVNYSSNLYSNILNYLFQLKKHLIYDIKDKSDKQNKLIPIKPVRENSKEARDSNVEKGNEIKSPGIYDRSPTAFKETAYGYFDGHYYLRKSSKQMEEDQTFEKLSLIFLVLYTITEPLSAQFVFLHKKRILDLISDSFITTDLYLRLSSCMVLKLLLSKLEVKSLVSDTMSNIFLDFNTVQEGASFQLYDNYLDFFCQVLHLDVEDLVNYFADQYFNKTFTAKKLHIITNNADVFAPLFYKGKNGENMKYMIDALTKHDYNPDIRSTILYTICHLSINLDHEKLSLFFKDIYNLVEPSENGSVFIKRANYGLEILKFFFRKTNEDCVGYAKDLMPRVAWAFVAETNETCQSINEIMAEIFKLVYIENNFEFIGVLNQALHNILSHKARQYINAFHRKDEYIHYLKFYSRCLVFGSAEVIQDSLDFLEILLKYSNPELIKEYMIKFIGPLIRISFYNLEPKSRLRVLQNLLKLYQINEESLVPYARQLQTSFFKALNYCENNFEILKPCVKGILYIFKHTKKRDLLFNEILRRIHPSDSDSISYVNLYCIYKILKTDMRKVSQAVLDRLSKSLNELDMKRLGSESNSYLVKIKSLTNSLDQPKKQKETILNLLHTELNGEITPVLITKFIGVLASSDARTLDELKSDDIEKPIMKCLKSINQKISVERFLKDLSKLCKIKSQTIRQVLDMIIAKKEFNEWATPWRKEQSLENLIIKLGQN